MSKTAPIDPVDAATMSDEALHAEMRVYLRGRPRQRWKYIDDPRNDRRLIHAPAYTADGTVTATNEADTRVVLEALVRANRHLHEWRSKAAKEAAKTRALRQARKVYEVAQKIVNGHVYGPRRTCFVCGRGLSDTESTARGIGSECWQGVLEQISKHKSKKLETLREAIE